MRLMQKSNHRFNEMVMLTLSHPSLFGSVWTRGLMYNFQGLQKLAKDVIYIFLSIVTSKKFNMRIELCFDHFFKSDKGGVCL